jgi:hypothetical protein
LGSGVVVDNPAFSGNVLENFVVLSEGLVLDKKCTYTLFKGNF